MSRPSTISDFIGRQIFLAHTAFGLIACGLLVYMPSGIHSIDMTSGGNGKSYIVGTDTSSWFNVFSWQYSTNIQEIDGMRDKHDWFGYPKLIVVNPGLHSLTAHCSWEIYARTLRRSHDEIDVEVKPNTVYLIESELSKNDELINTGCSVNLIELNSNDFQKLSNRQIEILGNYGYEFDKPFAGI